MKRALAVLPLLSLLVACGDDEGATGVADTGISDAILDTGVFDGFPSDTTSPDTTPPDTTPSDTSTDVREVEAPLVGLKDDPTYLVPGNVAPRAEVAAAGDLIAWVEGTDAAPLLVVWDISTPDAAPRAFSPPNLTRPRALALSDAFLVYVDDRYGDPDVFAIELATGAELAVVTRAGAQDAPAVLGARVAWEDCSACVTGDGLPGHEPLREIALRDLGGGDERALTADATPDRAPGFGLLADGRPALAWISGRAALRVERLQAGLSATWDVLPSLLPDQEVARVALWEGGIAWRPSPLIVNPDSMIVNPDSMYPSDVFTTAIADGATTRLTTHAELAGGMDLAPSAFGPRLGWLEIPPGVPGTGRVVLSSGGAPTTLAEAAGIVSFAMGRDFVVFTAPRADNDGEEDVHVLRLDLP